MLLTTLLLALLPQADTGSPYDLTGAVEVVEDQLRVLQGDVAVLVHQNGQELLRYSAGEIAPDTRVRLASLSKTVSAGVILSLVDSGELALDETLAEGLPKLFGGKEVGQPTLLDCWSMRHGIDTLVPFENLKTFGLLASVAAIARQGELAFEPGTKLDYDGAGMQATALIATKRTGLDWEELARERVFGPCGMDGADYGQFGKNPAVAGGLRATAEEIMAYADMVLSGGLVGEERVLSEASVELLFTDHTAGLPVRGVPFPDELPDNPDAAMPTYGFGDWILAKDAETGHVEEVFGAGAWGSFVWLDRRRGLSAVLIVDVPAASRRSLDAAMGLFRELRGAVEAKQASGLAATPTDEGQVALTWEAVEGASSYRVVGSKEPLRDIFDLAAATTLYEGEATTVRTEAFEHHAVLASFEGHENTALVPGSNAN